MCPHTFYVCPHAYYICVRILSLCVLMLNIYVSAYFLCVSSCLLYMCPHTFYICVLILAICVRILIYIGAHTLSADVCWRMLTYRRKLTYADVCWRMLTYADVCWRMLTYACRWERLCVRTATRRTLPTICGLILRYICVLILLCTCPHTTIYVSSYYYIGAYSHSKDPTNYMWPHTCYICVLILRYICVLIPLYMCPHATHTTI
jgi:hypothetical protein